MHLSVTLHNGLSNTTTPAITDIYPLILFNNDTQAPPLPIPGYSHTDNHSHGVRDTVPLCGLLADPSVYPNCISEVRFPLFPSFFTILQSYLTQNVPAELWLQVGAAPPTRDPHLRSLLLAAHTDMQDFLVATWPPSLELVETSSNTLSFKPGSTLLSPPGGDFGSLGKWDVWFLVLDEWLLAARLLFEGTVDSVTKDCDEPASRWSWFTFPVAFPLYQEKDQILKIIASFFTSSTFPDCGGRFPDCGGRGHDTDASRPRVYGVRLQFV